MRRNLIKVRSCAISKWFNRSDRFSVNVLGFRFVDYKIRNVFTLLLLLHWQLINYLFFLFTFSPPHRPHVDPTVNFYLNIASWIVKLYTITTNSTTTSTFLLFSLLLISIVSVWNGSLLTMECKRRKLKIGCPHCIGSFRWGTNWHFLCKSLKALH